MTVPTMLPEMSELDFTTLLDTMTAMYEPIAAGSPGVLPGDEVNAPGAATGFELVELANPLKLDGAMPPLSAFNLSHCAPQNVTARPTPALRLPITNVPPAVYEKTHTCPVRAVLPR